VVLDVVAHVQREAVLNAAAHLERHDPCSARRPMKPAPPARTANQPGAGARGEARAQLSRRPAHFFPAALAVSLGATIVAACGDDAGTAASAGPPAEAAVCTVPEGHDGSPETIEELVELINALPRPVTIPCLLQVLDRPLLVEATSNTFSAQPAGGAFDPRIFIFRGELVISVVTDGGARNVLEMSLRRSPTRSVKGELLFPIEAELPLSAPYDRVRADGGSGTKCWPCHLEETVDPLVTHAVAYESLIVNARPAQLVALETIASEHEACDPAEEPDRCAMLDALFDHGEVRHLPFSEW
jgi:hypothetical protein